MQGSRCEKATDRDLSVDHIQMQFVATQVSRYPLLFFLLPTLHSRGKSASSSSSVMLACRSSRVSSGADGGAPFFGLPRWRAGWTGTAAAGVRRGFSRLSISVESREI